MSNIEKRIEFGKFKGRKIKELPTWYLRWLSQQKGEMSSWAELAKEVLKYESNDGTADDFLRRKGYDPKTLKKIRI